MPIMSTHALRWTRSVTALRETALRAAFLRSEIARADIDALATALNDLCARAEQADPLAREVLVAMVAALSDPELKARIEAVRALASEQALWPLARLLRQGRRTRRAHPRHRQACPDPEPTSGTRSSSPPPAPSQPGQRGIATSASGRPLTLGERRALARKPSRGALDKLLTDPHPMVIRNVLKNPRITEDDVVRLAAKRPAHADAIVEIARDTRWSHRPRVRMAIVQNPGAPPEVAVPMIGLLIRPELVQVLAATDVPAVVRAAATELLQRRPPVPERRGRNTKVQ
jgi:hypothetical protein